MAAFGYGGTSYGGGGGGAGGSYSPFDHYRLVSPDQLRGYRLRDVQNYGEYVIVRLSSGETVRMYEGEFRTAERLGYFSNGYDREYRARIMGEWNTQDVMQAPAPQAPQKKEEPKKPERNVLKELYFRKRLHKK